jgi:predicted enzyme related to lactoylglutathione lyase
MQIKLTSIYVDNHDKALKFYTDVLGLQKKADFKNSGYRWLTVNSPEDPDGPELQLELNANPAAKAYQEAMFAEGQPALILHTKDVKADYDRVKARGGAFIMPPTDVTASIIAQVNDTCGNIIQFVQLNW